jgi:hypothetical protein
MIGTTQEISLSLIYLVFLAVLGLELRAYTISHSTSPFGDGYFQDRIS